MRNRTKGNKVKEKKKILKRRKREKEWERAGRGRESAVKLIIRVVAIVIYQF